MTKRMTKKRITKKRMTKKRMKKKRMNPELVLLLIHKDRCFKMEVLVFHFLVFFRIMRGFRLNFVQFDD